MTHKKAKRKSKGHKVKKRGEKREPINEVTGLPPSSSHS